MKKYAFVFSLLVALTAMTSCSNDAENGEMTGKGTIFLDLSPDLSYSRAFDEEAYTNTANYQVVLGKTEGGEPIYSGPYSEIPVKNKVESGVSYTVTASYGEDVAAGYDKLYVKGSQTFAVAEGDTKEINVLCTPANARLKLDYSNDFTSYYSDCQVSVKTDFMEEAWTMGIADEGKELFLKTGDTGTKAILSLQILDLDGNPVTVDGMMTTKELNMSPRDSYTVTIKPNVTEIEGGKMGISVSIDDGVTEDNININVPGDLI